MTFKDFMSDPGRASGTNSDAVVATGIRNESLMQVLPAASGGVALLAEKKGKLNGLKKRWKQYFTAKLSLTNQATGSVIQEKGKVKTVSLSGQKAR